MQPEKGSTTPWPGTTYTSQRHWSPYWCWSPWAFVGFEVTAFDTAHFKFSTKKSGGTLVLAILAAGFAYIAMVLVSVAAVPDGFSSWQEYIAALDGLRGIASVPTFFAAKSIMGTAALAVMTVTAVAAILTGIIGGYRATTRVLSTMAEDRILSEKFSKTTYSILFIMAISVLLSLLGRPDAKKIPIIALTANAFDEDVQRSLQAGLNAHLSKPVQPEALFETLEELITDGTGEA